MRKNLKSAPVALAAGLGLLSPVVVLHVGCSAPAKDKDTPLPAVSTFLVANDPAGLATAKDETALVLTTGGYAYLQPAFSTTGGTAVLNPGNLPVFSSQVVKVGPLTQDTTYTLTVTNRDGATVTKTAKVTIVAAPDATITAPASAITGTAGLQANVAEVVGATYAWSIQNGTLTAGDKTSKVTFTAGSAGAAGAAGVLELTCVMTNAAGKSDKKTFQVAVNARPPVGLTYPRSSATGYVGVPFPALAPTVAGGDPVQGFTVSPALPAGLTLNPTTGVVSGTPTATAASTVYTLSATNSGGSATFPLTLLLNAQPSATLTAARPVIGLGGGTLLGWTVDASVTSITVDQGIQATALDTTTLKSGFFPVSPAQTTTYTMTATLAGGESITLPPVTITVDSTPLGIASFASDRPLVAFGESAKLTWALTGTPVSLTLNGGSVLDQTTSTVSPVRRQAYTLLGSNGVGGANTASRTLVIPAQGLDTVAGSIAGQGYLDGPAAKAIFNAPFGVAADAAGNLYMADTFNHVIRMMDRNGQVTTLAGVPGTAGTRDSATGTPLFNSPRGIVVSPDGTTIYVGAERYGLVRKLVKSGTSWTVTTLAGRPDVSGKGIDGAVGVGTFGACYGLALNPAGTHLYVADQFSNTIRQVDLATGTIVTVAGSTAGYGHKDVTAAALNTATFNYPYAVAFNKAGTILYVADQGNSCIRAISTTFPVTVATQAGTVTTLAGSATTVKSYADGTGTAAGFNAPTNLLVDGTDTLYVADTGNHALRAVTSAGVVTTVAGLPPVAGSGTGAPPFVGTSGATDAATGSTSSFFIPQGLVILPGTTTLAVSDTANGTFRTVDMTTGATSTLAGIPRQKGYVDATGLAARFNQPTGLAVTASGITYVADTYNHVIRKIDANGVVTLLAGKPGISGNTDGQGIGQATFSFPQGVAVDPSGIVYVADNGNKSIRTIQADGTVGTAVVGATGGLTGPYAVVVDPTNSARLFVTDASNKVFPVTMATGVGTLGTAIGSGTSGFLDGAAATAKFKFGGAHSGIAADAAGNLYVADRGNGCIRKLDKANAYAVSTLAGMATATAPATNYGFIDGALGTNKFNFPQSLVVDAQGNLFVADYSNHAIRRIAPDGTVTTLVGKSSTTDNANGSPATLGSMPGALPASLYQPRGLALTPAGDVLIVTNDGIMQLTAPLGK